MEAILLEYTLACALMNGQYGVVDMDVSDISPEILSLINKINLIPDESMENREKGIRGTRVELVTDDGKRIEKTVLVPRGDPENPLTREEIVQKLHVCAMGQVNADKLDLFVNAVKNMKEENPFINPMIILGGTS